MLKKNNKNGIEAPQYQKGWRSDRGGQKNFRSLVYPSQNKQVPQNRLLKFHSRITQSAQFRGMKKSQPAKMGIVLSDSVKMVLRVDKREYVWYNIFNNKKRRQYDYRD